MIRKIVKRVAPGTDKNALDRRAISEFPLVHVRCNLYLSQILTLCLLVQVKVKLNPSAPKIA